MTKKGKNNQGGDACYDKYKTVFFENGSNN